MSKEDLIKPRFKVIAEHPDSRLKLGEVLVLNQIAANGRYWHQYSETEPVHLEDDAHIKYPAIFRKMEWWEEREEKDLPKYLKSTSGEVYKVSMWKGAVAHTASNEIISMNLPLNRNEITPATKEDYLKFKQP